MFLHFFLFLLCIYFAYRTQEKERKEEEEEEEERKEERNSRPLIVISERLTVHLPSQSPRDRMLNRRLTAPPANRYRQGKGAIWSAVEVSN